MELLHAVRMKLLPPVESPASHKSRQTLQPLDIAGSSLGDGGNSRILLVHGPVVATQNVPGGARELRSALLKPRSRPRIRGPPHYRQGRGRSCWNFAPLARVNHPRRCSPMNSWPMLPPGGWIENLRASGDIEADMKTSAAQDRITAGPSGNTDGSEGQPASSDHRDRIRPFGGAAVRIVAPPRYLSAAPGFRRSRRTVLRRTLKSCASALGNPRAGHIDLAGTRLFISPAHSTQSTTAPLSTTRLTAQKIEMDFGAQNRLSRLLGHNGSELERTQTGQAAETSTSKELNATFDAAGQWTSVVQTGKVIVHSADRSAQGDRGEFIRSTGLMTLSGAAQASDSQTVTVADQLTFHQATGEMGADGHVLTTYVNLPAQRRQVRISALHLRTSSPITSRPTRRAAERSIRAMPGCGKQTQPSKPMRLS